MWEIVKNEIEFQYKKFTLVWFHLHIIVLKKFSGNDRHFQIKNVLTHAHKKEDWAKQNGNLVPAKLLVFK